MPGFLRKAFGRLFSLLFSRVSNSDVLKAVHKTGRDTMLSIEGLNNAVAALKAEDALVIEAVGNLNKQIADLTAALAAAGSTDPAVQAAADAITAEVTKLQMAITPPAATS